VRLKAKLLSAVERLREANVPSPRMNAEILLMFTLQCDRAYLYAHSERGLTDDEIARYHAALSERSRGVPAQYITGHQEFWGMDLVVTPAVLIPRPETEHVVETALELVLGKTAGGEAIPQQTRPLCIVDVGTGSGSIALALAKELPQAEIHATDISSTALEIARTNAVRHQLQARIHFHQRDLLAGLQEKTFDLIVSNPPYVGESEEDQVQLEVRRFEPRRAVFAGPSGTETIARLIPQSGAALRVGGWLVMEISGTIVEATKRLLKGWGEIRIVKDLQDIPRVVAARKRI